MRCWTDFTYFHGTHARPSSIQQTTWLFVTCYMDSFAPREFPATDRVIPSLKHSVLFIRDTDAVGFHYNFNRYFLRSFLFSAPLSGNATCGLHCIPIFSFYSVCIQVSHSGFKFSLDRNLRNTEHARNVRYLCHK